MELSSLLVRNVTYEIPSLKKQIAKCQQLQQEYSRKEEEGQGGAAEMREQFYHSCKQYGITVSGGHRASACLLGPQPCIWERLPPACCALRGPASLLSALRTFSFICWTPLPGTLP